MLYPLLFHPIYKEMIWGGHALADKYKRGLDDRLVGESWEIACHSNGNGIISNGPLEGMSLHDAIDKYGLKILGSAVYNEAYKKFPLLIKILDAADSLSVQVHPDDSYAYEHENGELGKTEMWYVIDAKENAKIVYGLKEGATKESLSRCIDENRIGDCLKKLEVSAGDVVYIPSGMVHAIGDGIMICEIQQNSDTTYRLYDWDRVDKDGNARELHLSKAMDVIDYSGSYQGLLSGLKLQEGSGHRTIYVANQYFAVEKIVTDSSIRLTMDGKRFQTITCIEGSGGLVYEKGSIKLDSGSSCLIPAGIKDFVLEGQLATIRSYVPDRENNIIKPLLAKGIKRSELALIAGLFD